MQKQTQLTEKNVKAAKAEAGAGDAVLTVSPADELAARRIVCDGVAGVAEGAEYPTVARVAGVRLHVDSRLPKGVWEIEAQDGVLASGTTAMDTFGSGTTAMGTFKQFDEISVHRSDLEKVLDAVDAAVRHHAMRDESNAALHLSGVRLSPLTSALAGARDRLRGLLAVR
jgi:hypothetical protein